jgi:tRNA threonylcarbamoyladenosine biosynthesis protein TsaB
MIVLGIDSSTDRLGVGLADDNRIILEDTLDSAQEHATQIIGLIDSVLKRASVSKDKLDGVAVADGPGSFTGLRIGMAAAKGMARALNIPIVGISTFEVIARRALSKYDEFFLAAVVRKGELYLCRIAQGVEIRKNIALVSAENLSSEVGSFRTGLIGREPDGWQESTINKMPNDLTVVSGGELAVIGAEMINDGKASDLATLEPLYIARSQAEIKFGRK